MSAADQAPSSAGRSPSRASHAYEWVASFGDLITGWISGLGSMTIFSLRTFKWLLIRMPRREALIPAFYQIGVLSLPVVALTGTFIGMVLAVQSYSQFRALGLETRLGAAINMAIVRELGPVLAATMLAGRVGSAMAAQLGTMRVTEQIDALSSMGADPIQSRGAAVSRLPADDPAVDRHGRLHGRGWRLVLASNCWGSIIIITGRIRNNTSTKDLFAGIFKSFFFGAAIGLISCYRGFHCDAGPKASGRPPPSLCSRSSPFSSDLVLASCSRTSSTPSGQGKRIV